MNWRVLVEYIPILLGGGLRRLLILPISGMRMLANVTFASMPVTNVYGLESYLAMRVMSINLCCQSHDLDQ